MPPMPNVFDVHRANFGRARISPAAGAAKNFEFCLFVSLFGTLVNVGDCAHDFAMNVLEYRIQKRF